MDKHRSISLGATYDSVLGDTPRGCSSNHAPREVLAEVCWNDTLSSFRSRHTLQQFRPSSLWNQLNTRSPVACWAIHQSTWADM